MALIDCPKCNNKISDKAKNCPKCGYDPNQNNITKDIDESENTECTNGGKVTKKVSNSYCKIGFIMGMLSLFLYELGGIVPIIGIITSIKGLSNFDNKVHKNKWQGIIGLILSTLYVFAFFAKLVMYN